MVSVLFLTLLSATKCWFLKHYYLLVRLAFHLICIIILSRYWRGTFYRFCTFISWKQTLHEIKLKLEVTHVQENLDFVCWDLFWVSMDVKPDLEDGFVSVKVHCVYYAIHFSVGTNFGKTDLLSERKKNVPARLQISYFSWQQWNPRSLICVLGLMSM